MGREGTEKEEKEQEGDRERTSFRKKLLPGHGERVKGGDLLGDWKQEGLE